MFRTTPEKIDAMVLKFLRSNPGEEFRADQIYQLLGCPVLLREIRRSLVRLRKKQLVFRLGTSSNKRYWGSK